MKRLLVCLVLLVGLVGCGNPQETDEIREISKRTGLYPETIKSLQMMKRISERAIEEKKIKEKKLCEKFNIYENIEGKQILTEKHESKETKKQRIEKGYLVNVCEQ